MALPALVLLTKSVRQIMITILATIVSMDSGVIVSCPPAAWIVLAPCRRLVKTLGLAPQISRAAFWRK